MRPVRFTLVLNITTLSFTLPPKSCIISLGSKPNIIYIGHKEYVLEEKPFEEPLYIVNLNSGQDTHLCPLSPLSTPWAVKARFQNVSNTFVIVPSKSALKALTASHSILGPTQHPCLSSAP